MKNQTSFKSSFMAGLLAAATAIVTNSVIYFVGRATGIFTDDVFIQPGQSLTIIPVVFASTIPSLIGVTIFYLLQKFLAKGLMVFNVISTAFVLFSLISPFQNIPNVPLNFGILLDVMHFVVFGSVLFFVNKATKSKA